MVTVDEFSRLVSGIYAAAVVPEQWQPAIRDVEHALGGTGSALLIADTGIRALLSATLPPEAGMSYTQHYYRLDKHLAAVEQSPVGAVHTATELAARIKRNTEFYADWMRPFELTDGLFVRLTDGARPTCFVTTSSRPSFDTPERVKLMGGLVPHLQLALRTQGKLAALAQSRADLVGALDAVRHGVIVVGSDCWVMDLNRAAQAILCAQDGVHLHGGRIGANHAMAERKLHRALKDALVGDGSEIRRGDVFTCERSSGERPYVIHVLPLQRAGTDEMAGTATALVLIVDPEQEPEPAVALLRRLFGLTRTEADVAVRIVRGANLKEIADELAISVETVRTHLRHVFDKTDTHRQVELVRRLLTLGL